MNCKEVQEKLTVYLLGDITDADAISQIREHLEKCGGCRAVAQEIQPTLDLLHDALAVAPNVSARLSPERRASLMKMRPGKMDVVVEWVTKKHPRLARAAVILIIVSFCWVISGEVMWSFYGEKAGCDFGAQLARPSWLWGPFGFFRPTIEMSEVVEVDRSAPALARAPHGAPVSDGVPASSEPSRHGGFWAVTTRSGADLNPFDSYSGEIRKVKRVEEKPSVGLAAEPAAVPQRQRDATEKLEDTKEFQVAGIRPTVTGPTADDVLREKDKEIAIRDEKIADRDAQIKGLKMHFKALEIETRNAGTPPRTELTVQPPQPPAKPSAPAAEVPLTTVVAGHDSGEKEAPVAKIIAGAEYYKELPQAPAAVAPPADAPPADASAFRQRFSGTAGKLVHVQKNAQAQQGVEEGEAVDIVKSPVAVKGFSAGRTSSFRKPAPSADKIKVQAAQDKNGDGYAQNGPVQRKDEKAPGAGTYSRELKPGGGAGAPSGAVPAEESADGAEDSLKTADNRRSDGQLSLEAGAEANQERFENEGGRQTTTPSREDAYEWRMKLKSVDRIGKTDMPDKSAQKMKSQPKPEQAGEQRKAEEKLLTVASSVERVPESGRTIAKDAEKEALPVLKALQESAQRLQVKRPAEEDETGPRFKAEGVNPFVQVKANAFSTFAITVDTASFTLTRNYMVKGFLPPAEAVRTEEFVNFFDYAYRAPERETFKVYVEVAPSKFGFGLDMMKIGVKGKRIGREEQRRAVLTFLVDTSGSMDKPDRIGLVKKSLRMLVEKLNPHDLVAIVQYSSNARLVLDHTAASDKNKILGAIDALQCTGSTNLEDGMQKAYQVAARSFVSKGENRVLILSDGVANLGTMSAEDMLKNVEKYKNQGIYCSVFGVGMGSYDDTTLKTLANKGDGVYAFLDSEDEAKRIFVDDLAASLNTIAKDVKIQVEFNPARVEQYRQLGYESRQLKKEQFRDDTVDAGEVGSGQSVTALYELETAKNVIPVPRDIRNDARGYLAVVRVRYRNTDTGKVEEIERYVTDQDVVNSFDKASPRFKLAVCAAEFAEILRGSPFATGSEVKDVADVLRPVSLELSLDGRVQEFLRMAQSAQGMARGE